MRHKMKCVNLHAPGDLRYEEVDIPRLQEDEVLVKVKSAGICGSDFGRIMVEGTYSFSTIPGHEFAGVIADKGSTKHKVGERVCIAPLLPCFQCEQCQQGKFGQCVSYDFIGSRRNGAFAEYVAVPNRQLIPIPEQVSYVEAAMIEPAAVSLHGLYLAGVTAGQSVAVLGCGTLGMLCIELLREMGVAHIVAIDLDLDKLTMAQRLGADTTISAGEDDWLECYHRDFPKGCDVAVETAGSTKTQADIINLVKVAGTIVYMGSAHGDVTIKPNQFDRIVRGEICLVGSWNSYSAPYPGREWSTILRWLEQKKLDFTPLISRRIGLQEVPQVVAEQSEKRGKEIKIIIEL